MPRDRGEITPWCPETKVWDHPMVPPCMKSGQKYIWKIGLMGGKRYMAPFPRVGESLMNSVMCSNACQRRRLLGIMNLIFLCQTGCIRHRRRCHKFCLWSISFTYQLKYSFHLWGNLCLTYYSSIHEGSIITHLLLIYLIDRGPVYNCQHQLFSCISPSPLLECWFTHPKYKLK